MDETKPEPKPLRIVIVDDNQDAAKSLALLMNKYGHETFVGHDGPDALTLAKEHLPEVMMLDIGMPTISGYDVAKAVREKPWGQSIVLIATTGWGQIADKQRAEQAGFDHHLTKPIDTPTLLKILSGVKHI